MSEKCKCGKPMKFIKQFIDDGDETFIYECTDEECAKRKEISVCAKCEKEYVYWDE